MNTEEIMKLADAYAAAYMSFSESKARAALEAALSAKQGEQEAVKYEKQAFCYCDKDVSLQMVSGGGAPEGYLGRVTLRIGDQYRDYYAHPAPSVNAQEHWTRPINYTPPHMAYPSAEAKRISELEAQKAKTLTNEQIDELWRKSCSLEGFSTAQFVRHFARAAIAAVQSNASTNSLNSANSLETDK